MSLTENGDGPTKSKKPPLSRVPSYIRLTPRRAVASFENLVALANHQERIREARKIIWRDRGEPAVELADVWECIEHAGRGGLRAYHPDPFLLVLTHFSQELALSLSPFELASTLFWRCSGSARYQSEGSYLLRPIRRSSHHLLSSREMRFALIRHAIFGEDSFRFAAMLGVSSHSVLMSMISYIRCC